MSTNKLLTVNLVLPAAGNSGEEAVNFTRLLFGLTALALNRFGAAREHHCQNTLRESVPPRLAGVPLDPFDGQLLRFCKADDGYQLQRIRADLRDDPSGKGDLVTPVVGSPQVSPSERAQSHRHLPALIEPAN
jgi:hypothetical protein